MTKKTSKDDQKEAKIVDLNEDEEVQKVPVEEEPPEQSSEPDDAPDGEEAEVVDLGPEEESEWEDDDWEEDEDPEEENEEENLEESSDEMSAAQVVGVDFEEREEEPEAIQSEVEEERAEVESLPGAEEEGVQSLTELKGALECLLFTSNGPLSTKKARQILGRHLDKKILQATLGRIQMEYDARKSGLQIVETAEGWQMCTRGEYADYVLKLHGQRKKNPLSTTALETLAIVAYKQPITRAEVEMIRGVESSGIMRNLCDLGMVKVVGRKEVIGRPQLYGTTNLFLTTFGLKSCSELPSIQSLRRQFADNDLFSAAEDPSQPPQGLNTENIVTAEDNAEAREEMEIALSEVEGEGSPEQKAPEETPEVEEDAGEDGVNQDEETGEEQNAPEENALEENEELEDDGEDEEEDIDEEDMDDEDEEDIDDVEDMDDEELDESPENFPEEEPDKEE